MYRQILITQISTPPGLCGKTDPHRSFSLSLKTVTYEMSTLSAIRTLQQLGQDEKKSPFLWHLEALLHALPTWMISRGAPDLDCSPFTTRIRDALQSGGMTLHKWLSILLELLETAFVIDRRRTFVLLTLTCL
ncbi:hypothetical protein AVEN_88440-1 [Araneus ventricosus]|uniref:Uncharacterized protein n=1 Tax=Araneus ventricosus TaxID=182803 RepID=A0A4Y2L9V0_ARAVE|nr:hypothetical protein AVEN_88440-1 [Araneus ventricosus]